eukprot:SAG31_NODE_2084_length_6489_cov_7.773239_9_plen_111_part_00
MGMKALMVEYRLPIQWWPRAMESMRTGKNLWPMARSVKAPDRPDGDGPGAYELAMEGKVSHGMVLKSIARFVPVGTVTMLGNTNIIGSNVGSSSTVGRTVSVASSARPHP